MLYVVLGLSATSFVISIATFIYLLVIRRRLRRMPSSSPWSDEALTRDAWLEEIEARGQAVIDRIEEARRRWAPPVGPRVETSSDIETPARSSVDRLAGDAVPADESSAAPLERSSVREEVRRLADEGHDVAAIAQRLRLGRGEVELFLGLSDRTSAAK